MFFTPVEDLFTFRVAPPSSVHCATGAWHLLHCHRCGLARGGPGHYSCCGLWFRPVGPLPAFPPLRGHGRQPPSLRARRHRAHGPQRHWLRCPVRVHGLQPDLPDPHCRHEFRPWRRIFLGEEGGLAGRSKGEWGARWGGGAGPGPGPVRRAELQLYRTGTVKF